jgi:homoserine dehydrogenase
VEFQRFSEDSVFASIRGTSSALKIETDGMCPQLIIQEGPGLADTAYGIINDLMEISNSGSGSIRKKNEVGNDQVTDCR